MALILFSTTDLLGSRQTDFARLLRSLADNAQGETNLRAYILLQNCGAEALAALRAKAPGWCQFFAIDGRCSLSAARNLLIDVARHDEGFDSDDIIGFPDDDCWLPEHVSSSLNQTFAALPDLDMLICRIAPDPDPSIFTAEDVHTASAAQVVRLATSNGLFLRAPLFLQTGWFDNALGVGTASGGGEDTDFAIRASLLAKHCGFLDRAVIAHPAPDQNSAAKYYRGALGVLARHAGSSPALMREFLRKLLVGGYFILRGKLSIQTFLVAVGEARRLFSVGDTSSGPATAARSG